MEMIRHRLPIFGIFQAAFGKSVPIQDLPDHNSCAQTPFSVIRLKIPDDLLSSLCPTCSKRLSFCKGSSRVLILILYNFIISYYKKHRVATVDSPGLLQTGCCSLRLQQYAAILEFSVNLSKSTSRNVACDMQCASPCTNQPLFLLNINLLIKSGKAENIVHFIRNIYNPEPSLPAIFL